jgi:hypothetical protein
VKEDLFIHSSCIEHFVIRAKLMDLNELALATETIETYPDLERYAYWELAKR